MSDNTAHLLSKEQYDLLSNDLAALIGKVDESLTAAKSLNQRAEQTQKELSSSYDLDSLKTLSKDMKNIIDSIHEEKASLQKLHEQIDQKNKSLLQEVEERINHNMAGLSAHIKITVNAAIKDAPVILDTENLKNEMRNHIEIAFKNSNLRETLRLMEDFKKYANAHIPMLAASVNEIENVNRKLEKGSEEILKMPLWIKATTEEARAATKLLEKNSDEIKKSINNLNIALPIFAMMTGSISTFIVLQYGEKIGTLIKVTLHSILG
jgi:hypothetical protein